MTDRLISLRVDSDAIERADALIASLSQSPDIAATGRVTRSVVLRLALARGLAALEAEQGKGRGRRRKGGKR